MVHINDASRAVTVVGDLLKNDNVVFKEQIREEYQKFREQFLARAKEKNSHHLKMPEKQVQD